MQKVADFLVEKRRLIFVVWLVVTAVSAAGFFSVNINTDMTKYLSADSSMKQGLDLMEQQFPGSSDVTTINVMVDGLDAAGKSSMKKRLEKLDNVERVGYEPDSAEFNKDNHTLYQLTVMHPSGSAETEQVTQALDAYFSDASLVWNVSGSSYNKLELWIAAAAALILTLILVAMSKSWLEPLLFLIAIGIAIVINMGSNALLPSVSDTTNSIAAILQLVLSMDYSIILVNRYRQERALEPEPIAAMKKAVRGALTSVASSSLTTVVGLLSLLFMSFRIGGDIGVVLAKGVLISAMTIFAVLPFLLLACQAGVDKTAKPALHVGMNRIATFDHKFRWPITAAFGLLIVGAFFLQLQTHISFSMENVDPVSKVFAPTNTTVVIYDNDDAKGAAKLAEKLEDDPDVRSVLSYPNTLGRQYPVKKMRDTLADMDTDTSSLDDSMLRLLYYDYHTKGKLPDMTVAEFLSFVSNDVANDPNFGSGLSAAARSDLDSMKRFSDPADLTRLRDASGLASFFDMDVNDVQQLLLLYRIENGYVSSTQLTVRQFIDFATGDLANDPVFGSQMDAATVAQLNQLRPYTDVKRMTTKANYRTFASIMGMDKGQAKKLFMLRQVYTGQYQPSTMTMAELFSFIANDVPVNPELASQVDASLTKQAKQMLPYTDKAKITAPLDAQALAKAFGMSTEQVAGIFALRFQDPAAYMTQTLSMHEFVSFICDTVLADPTYGSTIPAKTAADLKVLYGIMDATVSDKALMPADAAELLGMTQDQATMLYAYRDMSKGAAESWKCTPQEMVNWMVANQAKLGDAMDAKALANLGKVRTVINGSVKGRAYTASQLAGILGMGESDANKLYLVYDYKHGLLGELSLSVQQFVHFLCDSVLANPSYAGMVDGPQSSSLWSVRRLIDAVVAGNNLTAGEMYDLIGSLDSGTASLSKKETELVFLLYGSKHAYNAKWTMSIEQLSHHLNNSVLKDSRFADAIGKSERKQMAKMETQIGDALKQLVGPDCSRMIVTATLPTEGEETTAFFDRVSGWCADLLPGESHMMGSSYMGYELQQTFRAESLLIMCITALAIFLVVALSFRSLLVPAILVLLVQCGVFITISIVGLQGYAINYLAMLIVECILMGATIDYGILTTNNYRESRARMEPLAALKDACNRSIMTILTSGLIMVSVTAIVGNFFENPAIGQICRTISIGSACAIVLIVFVLPALLSAFDKHLFPKRRKRS